MSYFSEANKYYNSKEYKKAISYYRKSIADKENEACSYYNAGVCFIKLKDYKKALLNFNLAWAINNNDEDCKKAMNLILKKATAEN